MVKNIIFFLNILWDKFRLLRASGHMFVFIVFIIKEILIRIHHFIKFWGLSLFKIISSAQFKIYKFFWFTIFHYSTQKIILRNLQYNTGWTRTNYSLPHSRTIESLFFTETLVFSDCWQNNLFLWLFFDIFFLIVW